MYVCQLCKEKVGPRVALLTHRVLRAVSEGMGKEKGSILREVPICPGCHLRIRIGESPLKLERNGSPQPIPQENPILAPLLPPKKAPAISVPAARVFEVDAE